MNKSLMTWGLVVTIVLFSFVWAGSALYKSSKSLDTSFKVQQAKSLQEVIIRKTPENYNLITENGIALKEATKEKSLELKREIRELLRGGKSPSQVSAELGGIPLSGELYKTLYKEMTRVHPSKISWLKGKKEISEDQFELFRQEMNECIQLIAKDNQDLKKQKKLESKLILDSILNNRDPVGIYDATSFVESKIGDNGQELHAYPFLAPDSIHQIQGAQIFTSQRTENGIKPISIQTYFDYGNSSAMDLILHSRFTNMTRMEKILIQYWSN